MSFLDDVTGDWQGSCAFRLMPDDDLTPRPSRATTASEAHGVGWSLRYTWEHADDGEQAGTLLLGSPADDGSIAAGWVDSWHQKPDLRLLTGAVVDGKASLEMEYSGWGWQITVEPQGAQLLMTMSNVVPEGVDGAEPGAYVVMDATWSRA